MLPKTQAKSVEERRDEIVGTRGDEFLKVVSYKAYDKFPEVKIYKGKPENIRFYSDGLEVLVDVTSSNRAIATFNSIGSLATLDHSPISMSYIFQLIDERKQRILQYTIDAQEGEY
ncbi:hypothetical protein J4221_07235 [Candidatus Pacearchaeota archaeon]|nr:hypothetical protein [Candidatus Pacearchaeota archaeon]